MTPHRRHGASRGSYAAPALRASSGAHRWTRKRGAESGRARQRALRAPPDSELEGMRAGQQLDDLWDLHGTSVYALACALLGDEKAAAQAVTLGMADLARSADSVSPADARRSWAGHVYWRSQEVASETASTPDLPPAMVWLGQLSRLQRACLALCLFGGHTRGEAADLLGVPPTTVADLLTAGLREVARLAVGPTAASA